LGRRSSSIAGFLSIGVAAIIWGSNGVIVNLIGVDALAIAFYRALIATMVSIPLALIFRRREFIDAAMEWRILLFNGSMNALGWGTLFYSMKLIPIAVSVLLNYLAPVFVAILAPLILRERIRLSTIISLALSIAGVIVILSERMGGGCIDILGVFYGILSGLFYAMFVVTSKMVRGRCSSYTLASYTYLFTSIILLILVYLGSQSIIVDVGYLPLLLLIGLFNTSFAVTLYFHGLGLIEAQKAIILTYLEPLSVAVFGTLFLGQIPTTRLVIGGVLILVSSYITARY